MRSVAIIVVDGFFQRIAQGSEAVGQPVAPIMEFLPKGSVTPLEPAVTKLLVGHMFYSGHVLVVTGDLIRHCIVCFDGFSQSFDRGADEVPYPSLYRHETGDVNHHSTRVLRKD